MAAEVLSGISSALATTLSARLKRQWNRAAVTAKMLPMIPATGQGGGKQIAWDVAFSGATAASFAEGSDIAGGEYNTDPMVPAVLGFGQYRSAFQLSNLEIKAAAASVAGPRELGRIVVERLDGSLAKMASVANADMWSGTGLDGSSNPNIIGIIPALAATGSYAGLSKTTYSEWAGNVLANGGTARALSQDLLYNLEQLIFVASGRTPKVIVCSPGVYRKYAGLFESIKRVMVGPDGTVPSFSGGAQELSWKGMPVIRDRSVPAGTMAMIDTDEIAVRPLTGVNDEDSAMGVSSMALPSTNGDTSDSTPITCDVYPLGRTGSGIKFVAEMYLQLQVTRVNAHGLIQDLSEV